MEDERKETSKSCIFEDKEKSNTIKNIDSIDGRLESNEDSRFIGRDIVISYKSRDNPVIDGESVYIPKGNVTSLIGPNGSGKSTLLKGLADQISLNRGSVLLDGKDIHKMEPKKLARKLGLLSQENSSPESINVEDLVSHGRYPHRGFLDTLSQEDEDAVNRAISLAGIENLRDRKVGNLSGGQKQLVWIAMVLAQQTDVLLLDEPTTFLDLHHQLEVMEIVETLRDESDITVVIVLHNIDQAARYSDYILALKDGCIQDCGTPEQVITENLLKKVFGIKAEVNNTEHGPQVTPLKPVHDGSFKSERKHSED